MADSPCIGLCRLDASGAVCEGCGRTLTQIAAWSGYTREQRQEIMRRLAPVGPVPELGTED